MRDTPKLAYARGYAQALRDARRIALDRAASAVSVAERREARLIARRIDDLLREAVAR